MSRLIWSAVRRIKRQLAQASRRDSVCHVGWNVPILVVCTVRMHTTRQHSSRGAKTTTLLAQPFNRDIAEHHGVIVPGEPEMAAGAVFAGVRRIVFEFRHLT